MVGAVNFEVNALRHVIFHRPGSKMRQWYNTS